VGEIAVRQAILHGLVAAGFVEALLCAWRIRRARTRLGFWVLALAFPFLVLPSLLVLAPFRSTDRFAAGWALFASARWNAVQLRGIGVDTMVFGLLGLAGTLLFLRDVVPFVAAPLRGRLEDHAPHRAPSPALAGLVDELAGRMHARVPATVVLQTDAPVLFVRGVVRQALVVSDGVVARLTAGQLRAAVAHELAHVRLRDPLAGWALMTARLVMFWNPAVQLVARAIVEEMEHRADAAAAAVTDPQTFAGALRALASLTNPVAAGSRPTTTWRSDPRRRIELLAERLHHAHIAARLALVLAASPVPRFAWTRLAVVGATLGILVFFVV